MNTNVTVVDLMKFARDPNARCVDKIDQVNLLSRGHLHAKKEKKFVLAYIEVINVTKLPQLSTLLLKGWFPYDRRSQKVRQSSAIIWKQLSVIACDLRSPLVCDHLETSL